MDNLLHVVLISFKPEAPPAARDEAFVRLKALAEDCGGAEAGILFWRVQPNLDRRRNVHLVEVGLFEGGVAFGRFKEHPKHQEFARFLARHADWQVGDINLDTMLFA